MINTARDIALENQHQQLSTIHVAVALFEDPEGIAKQSVLRVAGEESYRSVVRVLRRTLVRWGRKEGRKGGQARTLSPMLVAFFF